MRYPTHSYHCLRDAGLIHIRRYMRKFLVTFAVACSLLLMTRPLLGQIQGGWVNTGNMSVARERGVQVTLHSGRALVTGGTDGTNVLASAEIYDPSTGVWTGTGAMGMAREYFAAVVLKNGKVLVIGGTEANGSTLASA